MKEILGVVHGRFQIFHNDHLKYVLAAKKRCEHIIIGICNPDINYTDFSQANPHRSQKRENPFTYYERFEMIKSALIEAGMTNDQFDIVPFPINFPEMIFNYAPYNAKYYMTIYDGWGREKESKLRSIGCDVEILWEVELSQKGISGSDIRELIRTKKEWKQYVPSCVYDYIIEHKLDERICSYCIK